jgi:prepilin-type N-terminal cleavage/methylation domain-containing protein
MLKVKTLTFTACAGFTLIEVMVVIFIMSILAMAAAPLTVQWVYRAHVYDANSQLTLAYAQTKALALRNPCSAPALAPAATLEVELIEQAVHLRIMAGRPEETASSCRYLQRQPNPQWQTILPSEVALTWQGIRLSGKQSIVSAQINSRGTLASNHSVPYQLSKGDLSNAESGSLY